jgi:hypothetical protein
MLQEAADNAGRSAFEEMLRTHTPPIRLHASFRSVAPALEKDARFRAIASAKLRELIFEEYMLKLEESERVCGRPELRWSLCMRGAID